MFDTVWRPQRDEILMPEDAVFPTLSDPHLLHLDPTPHTLRTPALWVVLGDPAMTLSQVADTPDQWTLCAACLASVLPAPKD